MNNYHLRFHNAAIESEYRQEYSKNLSYRYFIIYIGYFILLVLNMINWYTFQSSSADSLFLLMQFIYPLPFLIGGIILKYFHRYFDIIHFIIFSIITGIGFTAIKSGILEDSEVVYESSLPDDMGDLKFGYILGCISFTGITGTNFLYLFMNCSVFFIYGLLFLGNLSSKNGNFLIISLYIFMLIILHQKEKRQRQLYMEKKKLEVVEHNQKLMYFENNGNNIIKFQYNSKIHRFETEEINHLSKKFFNILHVGPKQNIHHIEDEKCQNLLIKTVQQPQQSQQNTQYNGINSPLQYLQARDNSNSNNSVYRIQTTQTNLKQEDQQNQPVTPPSLMQKIHQKLEDLKTVFMANSSMCISSFNWNGTFSDKKGQKNLQFKVFLYDEDPFLLKREYKCVLFFKEKSSSSSSSSQSQQPQSSSNINQTFTNGKSFKRMSSYKNIECSSCTNLENNKNTSINNIQQQQQVQQQQVQQQLQFPTFNKINTISEKLQRILYRIYDLSSNVMNSDQFNQLTQDNQRALLKIQHCIQKYSFFNSNFTCIIPPCQLQKPTVVNISEAIDQIEKMTSENLLDSPQKLKLDKKDIEIQQKYTIKTDKNLFNIFIYNILKLLQIQYQDQDNLLNQQYSIEKYKHNEYLLRFKLIIFNKQQPQQQQQQQQQYFSEEKQQLLETKPNQIGLCRKILEHLGPQNSFCINNYKENNLKILEIKTKIYIDLNLSKNQQERVKSKSFCTNIRLSSIRDKNKSFQHTKSLIHHQQPFSDLKFHSKKNSDLSHLATTYLNDRKSSFSYFRTPSISNMPQHHSFNQTGLNSFSQLKSQVQSHHFINMEDLQNTTTNQNDFQQNQQEIQLKDIQDIIKSTQHESISTLSDFSVDYKEHLKSQRPIEVYQKDHQLISEIV